MMLDCLNKIHRRVAEDTEVTQRFSSSLRSLSALCDSAVKEQLIEGRFNFKITISSLSEKLFKVVA